MPNFVKNGQLIHKFGAGIRARTHMHTHTAWRSHKYTSIYFKKGKYAKNDLIISACTIVYIRAIQWSVIFCNIHRNWFKITLSFAYVHSFCSRLAYVCNRNTRRERTQNSRQPSNAVSCSFVTGREVVRCWLMGWDNCAVCLRRRCLNDLEVM